MEREFLLNYKSLNDYIREQQKNPDRTDWELTMLRDNCKKYITDTTNNPKEYVVISINDSVWDVTINWQKNLQDKFNMLPTWYEMNKKARLYRQIKLSMEEAEKRGIFEQIFKEIRGELDYLKESINNSN